MRTFEQDDFQFGFEIALGASYRGAADVGEVLATAARVNAGAGSAGSGWSTSPPSPAARLEIPYEDDALPAWFFRAAGAAPGERRPLVVMNNGSDGATSAMWLMGGAAAHERG